MEKKKVSIIVPTYNRANILEKVIDSILRQTYAEFELLVIDDSSTDDTEELISSYLDSRIIYHKLEQNSGPSAARNYGIKQSAYDYIAFGDSDDIWHMDKLQKQMELLQDVDTDVGFCYHKIRYDMGGNQYAVLPSDTIPLEKKSGDIYDQLLYDNLVGCPTMLIRRDCILQTDGFDTDMKALEDYDLALQMAKRKKAVFVNEVLLESSYSVTGVSGNSVNYLLASCHLVFKYKVDYLKSGTLNHRLESILRDADRIGMKQQFVQLLERIMIA